MARTVKTLEELPGWTAAPVIYGYQINDRTDHIIGFYDSKQKVLHLIITGPIQRFPCPNIKQAMRLAYLKTKQPNKKKSDRHYANVSLETTQASGKVKSNRNV